MNNSKITAVAMAVGNSLFLSNATADTIVLPPNSTQTLTASFPRPNNPLTGLPFIESTITIQGDNSVFDRSATAGTPAFRLITVFTTNGDLTINDLTIRNGSPGSTFKGGGIYLDTGGELNEAGQI